jgi:uncharacterized protein
MKVEGAYRIEGPRERVWRLMIDPEVLQRCVPGCQSLEVTEDGFYKISLKAGVGSIKGLFNGSIKLEELREPEHYKMIVDGKGSSGFLRGVGTLDLSEEGEEGNNTTVNYLGEVNVGGTIASVGQRMIQSSAKLMIGQFFAAIDAESKAVSKAEKSNEPFEPPKQGFIRNTIRHMKKN